MIAALIVAAGQGKRMGTDQPKQFLEISGKPILSYSLALFDRCHSIDRVYIVLPEADIAYCNDEIVGPAEIQTPVALIAGGSRRQNSVNNGLKEIPASDGIVLIHDGVRPFLSKELVNTCISGAKKYGACIPAIPVVDTLKKAGPKNDIRGTLSRDGLYMAQTPQTFRLPLIVKAHAEAVKHGWEATDDASLVEKMGEPVYIVQGMRENLKITTPEDLAWAETYLKMQEH